MVVVESRIECVVLAAGSSERLGQSKVLVNIGEDTLVGWIVRRLVTQGLSPVVVTRSEIEREVAEATFPCEVLVNPNPDAGRTGTLQLGIANLDVVTGHVLVDPVDHLVGRNRLDRLANQLIGDAGDQIGFQRGEIA